jgi:mannose/fructose-specific phosphotransferase system component IIA
MSKNYFTCIITHGNLANSLKDISEKLATSGTQMFCYTNQHLSLEEIKSNIEERIDQLKPDKIILFVDLAGGSCWHLANRIKKDHKDAVIISGVNVPLIVSYQINYNCLEWDDLLNKIVEDGKKGILTL